MTVTTSEQRRRRLLIISPAFPPRSTPDSQRVRMSLPYYAENGWDAFVLAVDPNEVDAPEELSLLQTLPDHLPIYHSSALPKKLSRRLGLGNLGLRAWWPLACVGARLIREHRIDLVYFSTTQFAVLPLGRLWRALCGVPFVVDLQDPWRTDYYERSGVRRPPGGWKYQVARAQAALLEPWSFRKAIGLISVSENYLHDLRARYVWFRGTPSMTIGFGASQRDLDIAKQFSREPEMAHESSRSDVPTNASGRLIHFVYTGASGPITPHAVSLLFSALAAFSSETPTDAARLRFHFIGTSYAPADQAVPSILPLAEKYGVNELITESAPRAGHLECLRAQACADVLLLCGSSDRAYSPSKLYPYFLAKRPVLALVFRDSVLESTLRKLGGAEMISFSENELAQAQNELLGYFRKIAASGPTLPLDRQELYFQTHYLARSLTKQQTDFFDRALEHAHADVTVV